MSTLKKINSIKGIKKLVSNSISYKLLFEFLGSFTIIFLINIFLSLGEMNISDWFFNIFHTIYNVNVLSALWIATITIIAFIFYKKTSICSNALTLVIQYKNEKINRKVFYYSAMAQLAGGVLASLIVYLITMGFAIWLTADYNTYNDFTNVIHSMGGGTPYLRGFFTHATNGEYESFNLYKPIDFSSYDNKGIQFGYSSIQGIINVLIIMTTFIFVNIIEKNFNRYTHKILLRYIMLIVLISISIVFSANTTNWVRLISPTIINGIFAHNIESGYRIATTLVYIMFQFIGLIFIFKISFFIK